MSAHDPTEVYGAIAAPDTLVQISDALDVGCVAVDAGLFIQAWNHWLEAATGRGASQVIGVSLLSVFPELAGTAGEHAFRRAAAGEAVVFAHSFHEYLLPLPTPVGVGHFTWMQQSARVMPFIRDGQPNGAVAFIQDVTERIVREQELYDAKQRAEAANEGKSDFLKAMSHEFRTPLNAILGYANLLQNEIAGPLNEAQHEHLQRMISGANHLVDMVNEILTFAAIEAQQASVSIEPADVAAIAGDVVSLLENSASQKGIELQVELLENLMIPTDAQRLKQILMNVVGNAVKFTERGSVTVAMTRGTNHVEFVVTDTGPGIPEQHRERIFEPFVQVGDKGKLRQVGTGLGLPLSRSLTELIGGTLTLRSTGEPGSCFVIRLPNHNR